MGQGFGGWAQSYRYYAASFGNTMIIPPHNTLVYAWSLSGIVAVLLILAFMFSVIGFGMKAQRSPSAEVRAMAAGMTLSFLVVFIQGMGENHGVVGDMHMQPPLAVLLGLTYAHYRRARSALPEAT